MESEILKADDIDIAADNLLSGNVEDGLEIEDNFSFDPKLFNKVNKNLLQKLEVAIQESSSLSEFLDTCQKGFSLISVYANTIDGTFMGKELVILGTSIADRVKQFIEHAKAAEEENKQTDLIEKVISTLTSSFSNLGDLTDQTQLRLTFSSACGIIKLIRTITKDFVFTYQNDFAKLYLNVSHYLETKPEALVSQTQKIYLKLSKLKDFDLKVFQDLVQNELTRKVKYTYLGLISKDQSDNSKLLNFLSEQYNQLVLNDKEKLNYDNLKFFIPFLNSLNDVQFKNLVYPQIEFMLNRSGAVLSLVGPTLDNLKNVTFNSEIVQMITQAILTDSLLTSSEFQQDVTMIFETLGKRVCSSEVAREIISDFLLKRFEITKKSANPQQRQNIIKHLAGFLKTLKNEFLLNDILTQTLQIMLDHLFSVKEEVILKEAFEDIVQIYLKSDNFSQLNDHIQKLISKASNTLQIALFSELIYHKKTDLALLIQTITPQVKQMLNAENYKTTANYSQILALSSFMCYAYQFTKDSSYIQFLIQNGSINGYFTTQSGYVNTPGYFQKNPSLRDTKYHLQVIETFLAYHYQDSHLNNGDSVLRDTLFEYLLNQTYKFREHVMFDTLEALGSTTSSNELITSNLLKSIFIKVKQVSARPNLSTREDIPHQSNVSVGEQVRHTLKFILKNQVSELNQESFFTLLKTISHPYVSKNNRDLMKQVKSLERIYSTRDENLQLKSYIEKYGKDITNFAIFQRTGLISQDSTLRKIGINMATILASQKGFELFVSDLKQILDYKPLEMIAKLQNIFEQEFDRISHYDLMFYSEITKDLLNVFKDFDAKIVQRELGVDNESLDSNGQEEEKKAEPEAVLDPSKLAAQLMKQQAALKKATAAKKAPAKGAVTKAPVKAAAKQAPKQEDKKQEQPMDKEQRNKMDRQQLLSYLNQITNIKAQQAEAVFEVLKNVNNNNFYLDTTLQHVLMPMVRLLSYPSTRFSTTVCLQQLFKSHKSDPLFQVKNEVVSCLLAISQGKIFQKHMREFTHIFQHIEANTNLDFFDKGYIDLILTMGNSVLKDMSVHLSVKEQALSVIQSFLTSDKVNDLELVRVTINMMKSSYNSKNLGQYLHALIRRLKLEHLALILQRLFEYEPVPRMTMLKELIEYEEPLCCPVWFSTQIWVLQFDEDSSKVARRVWNKYGMALRNQSLDHGTELQNRNLYYYLRSSNTNIYDATLKATVAAIEIFQNRYDFIIDDLVEFYNKEMQIIEQAGLKNQQDSAFGQGNQRNSQALVADERLNRIAVAEIIKRTAHLVQANSFKKIYDFFILQGCLDQNEHVAKACLDAALSVIKAKGPDYAEDLLKILEKYINEQKKYSELSKNQAIIMIGSLASYLDNTSQKKLVGTFEKMLELLNTPSELIRQSICKVIPQLARFFDDKSKKFLEDNMTILKTSSDEKLLRGSAYAVSGIIKGLGLQTFNQMDLLTTIHKECFGKHADPMRKVSGLYLYETLSISLGKVFEMNIEKILPDIMLCISDPKDVVRRAAINSNRTIMGNLSNHAIKQVLPIFLNGLYVENWRSKLASVEALGNMAYCAPRQISGYLPKIVKGIREVLNDTHEKVHAAALQAIQNIGSVIKCPEIADLLEVLVKALSNPTLHLKDALKILLETSFVHAIDAPSLSLLVPILDSGLMMHDNESKHLASRLMGNICNLTQDSSDLLPYIKILMPAIRNSLFDSIPEIRASAAKALGSLSRGLGLQNSEEMIVWLDNVLHQRNLQVSERNGAAQGLAEIVAVHGVGYFEEILVKIVGKSKDKDPQIRESFRSVLVFAATCFDQFVKYLPELLPLMIQGLSDEAEDVRKVSLRNVKICIKQFGKIAPLQLVDPIMSMMFHKDFKVRSSSSVLMYQLVKELENDIIKSQPKYVSQETKEEILAAMFILRYDIIERVAMQAAQIWKNIIDNQMKVVKTILPVLVKQIFALIQNENLELQEMGLNCMRGIVEKFGEKITGESLDILESYMERATSLDQTVAITKCIFNMTYAAPVKLLSDMRSRFLNLVDPNLNHVQDDVRKLSAQVYLTVFQKTYEPLFITSYLDKSFLKKLNHIIAVQDEREAVLLIETLKFMLKESPELKLEDKLIKLCKLDLHETPITISQARILAAVSPKVAQHMFKKKFYATVLTALTQELTVDEIDDEVRIQEVLKTFSELISSVSENEIVTINEQIIADFHFRCKEKGRLPFYVDFLGYYCTHAKVNYEKFASQYLYNVLILMNDKNEKLVEKVGKSFNSIINGLQKENQFTHIPLIKEVIEELAVDKETVLYGGLGDRIIYRKKMSTIKLLEKVDGVRTLSTVIQNSITHGSIDIRIDSAICFQYLIDFSKLEAIKLELIKICGALIRVVNDKFPPSLKLQIFQALKLLLVKATLFIKPMAPQLQTTFLKAFSDSTASPLVRKVVVECLIHFLKIAPKIDPVVKELTTMLDGDKLEKDSKVEVAEILAIIVRQNGKTIQGPMAQQIQTSLSAIIQEKKASYSDKTVLNSAVAFAFLSGLSSDPSLPILFEQFDSTLDVNVTLGIKFGLIMNGVQYADRSKMISKTEEFVQEMLKDFSGIMEIDQRESEDAKEGEEGGRLHGVVEAIAHIGDVFVRRYAQEEPEIYTSLFRVINKSEILKKLNQEKDLSSQTFDQVLNYLAWIPVRVTPGQEAINPELVQVINEGMEFISNFYLEFDSKRDAFPAVINMFALNYDNFLNQTNDEKLELFNKERAREVIYNQPFASVVSENLRSLALELLFIKSD